MRYVLILVASFALASTPVSAQVSAPNDAAQISDWKWYIEEDFGTDGAVRWIVQVENTSDRPIYHVEVELTTYDEDGTPLTTDLGIVERIPVDGVASTEERADYHGDEAKARTRITQVYWEE